MNLGLALLSAVLLIAVFPRWNWTWLAPVALAPLLVSMARESGARRRFLLGWAAGAVYWGGVCYWIEYVLAVHSGLSGWLAGLSFVMFALFKGLHLAVFALLAGWLMPRWYALPLVAALWTGIERTHGPLAFTWLLLGNAGIDMPLLMRLAPVVGVYGLSFVFAMLGAAVAMLALRRPRRELAWLLVLPSLGLLPSPPAPVRGREAALAVQPNLAEDRTWNESSIEAMHRRMVALSLDPGARLILWPEAPAPLYYTTDPGLREKVNTLARLMQAYVLLGTVALASTGEPLNSALMVSPAGEPIGRYDKIKLVPFGEFVPWPFGWVNRVTKEAGDFAAGARVDLLPYGEHRLGAFICYEAAFPNLVRRFAGAEVLVNLSNDGYFGHSAAREQHLLLARMRAAENARWLLRVTNDGITAAIDPAGRLAQHFAPNREQSGTLFFSFNRTRTLYSARGDWFAWGCLVLSLVLVARLMGVRGAR